MEKQGRDLSLDLRAAYEAGKLAVRFDIGKAEMHRPRQAERPLALPPGERIATGDDGWHH